MYILLTISKCFKPGMNFLFFLREKLLHIYTALYKNWPMCLSEAYIIQGDTFNNK